MNQLQSHFDPAQHSYLSRPGPFVKFILSLSKGSAEGFLYIKQ